MSIQTDFAWFLCRLNTNSLFSTAPLRQNDGQPIPSWSAFNATISAESPPVTSIGYYPMINASTTEYSTIYTVMKNVQMVMASLQQKYSVITFDFAIYSEAKEIQWRDPEEFKDTILRLGGFHVALNYLAVIGKMFEDSGLYDILGESGIYGSTCNVALVLFQGRSYSRGVRAHKIAQQGLLRLQWQAFLLWMENQEIQADVHDDLKPNFRLLLDSTGPIQELHTSFCSKGKVASRLFRSFLEQLHRHGDATTAPDQS